MFREVACRGIGQERVDTGLCGLLKEMPETCRVGCYHPARTCISQPGPGYRCTQTEMVWTQQYNELQRRCIWSQQRSGQTGIGMRGDRPRMPKRTMWDNKGQRQCR